LKIFRVFGLIVLFASLSFGQGRLVNPPVGGGADTTGMLKRVDTSWVATKSYVLSQSGAAFDSASALAYTKSLISLKLSVSDSTSFLAYVKSLINSKQASGTYLVPSDTSSLVSRFAAKQNAGTYLVPSDSTSIRTYSGTLYLKNADSTTLKNSLLKNADSTAIRNYSGTLYLKNADSTTLKNSVLKNADSTSIRNYSTSLYLGKPAGSMTDGYIVKIVGTTPTWRPDSTGSGEPGGASDGQNADSIQGKPVSAYRTTGKLAVAYDPDSSGYRHMPLVRFDTTGFVPGRAVTIDTSGGSLFVVPDEKDPTAFVRINSDTWYTPQHGQTALAPATQALVTNTIRAWPFFISRPYAIDSMKFEVSTGGAGNVSFGLYEDQDGDLYPDSLRLDFGAYTTTNTAVKTDTSTCILSASGGTGYTLKKNTLYFVASWSLGTATLRSIAVGGLLFVLGHNPAIGTNSMYTCWSLGSQTYTYPQAMPLKFPSSAAKTANIGAPLLVWRVKP